MIYLWREANVYWGNLGIYRESMEATYILLMREWCCYPPRPIWNIKCFIGRLVLYSFPTAHKCTATTMVLGCFYLIEHYLWRGQFLFYRDTWRDQVRAVYILYYFTVTCIGSRGYSASPCSAFGFTLCNLRLIHSHWKGHIDVWIFLVYTMRLWCNLLILVLVI